MRKHSYLAHLVSGRACDDSSSVQEHEQSLWIHNNQVAKLALERGRESGQALANLAYLAGLLHDLGKYSNSFQEYIRQDEKNGAFRRGDVNHATAGGLLAEELAPRTGLSEVLQSVIYSHHGLRDCIDVKSGYSIFEKRQSPEYKIRENIEYDLVKERAFQDQDEGELHSCFLQAKASLKELMCEILNWSKEDQEHYYGSRDFYLGMLQRRLLSLVIDADRSDTAQFMRGAEIQKPLSDAQIKQFWHHNIEQFEHFLNKFESRNKINEYRAEISRACLKAAGQPCRLYRLTLPTGSGKTLSSLRFALHHGFKYGKKRIIYVAPFHSILEQNADEIRRALGDPQAVLEHHCNFVPDTEEARKQYERLTENWLNPVIATTAVQLLDTLFSGKTGSVRRMNSLSNSILIFDEIQALPIRTTCLFNLAINYLTVFCNTTVVLCSATQPVLDELSANRLLPPKEMVKEVERYDAAFRRTTLNDCTGGNKAGLSTEELGEFVLERLLEENQILVVVNTKSCAKHVYEYLKSREISGCSLYHLSTSLCPENRREILDQIKEKLMPSNSEMSRPLICVSTQLIEAGVDLSFRCVVRSLAGLDSIIQAAGRCNRHGTYDNGNVYIVKMSREAENITRLPDIRTAQEAMNDVLYCARTKPDLIDGDLLSEKARKHYYRCYMKLQKEKLEYPETVCGAPVTLVDLLSSNQFAMRQYCRIHGAGTGPLLRQAFQTAGDLFEVIPEDGKVNVVTEYNDMAKSLLMELEKPDLSYDREKEILRKLQLYTVGISETLKQNLGNAVYPVRGGLLYGVNEAYYSKETGVLESPAGMGLLNY